MKNLIVIAIVLSIAFFSSCTKDEYHSEIYPNAELTPREYSQDKCGLTDAFCGDRNPIYPPQGPSIVWGHGIISKGDSDEVLKVKCGDHVYQLVPFESYDRQRSFLVKSSEETFILHNRNSKLLSSVSEEEDKSREISSLSVLLNRKLYSDEYNIDTYESTLIQHGARMTKGVLNICDVTIDEEIYAIVRPCQYSISSNASQFIQSLTSNSDSGFIDNLILQFGLLTAFGECPSDDLTGSVNGCSFSCVDPTCVIDQILDNPVLPQESKDLMTANYLQETLGLSNEEADWLTKDAPDGFLDEMYDQLNSGECESEDCSMQYSVQAYIELGMESSPDLPTVSLNEVTLAISNIYCEPDGECILNSVGPAEYLKMLDRSSFRSEIVDELDSSSEFTDWAMTEYAQTGTQNSRVYYNLYGYHGISRWINGEWVNTRWNYAHDDDESFVYRNGQWEEYFLPDTPQYDFNNIISELAALGHITLDCAGLIPVIGEIADGINAVWYFAEGDYVNGSLSAAAMVPFLGITSTTAKWSRNLMKFVKRGSDDIWESPKGLNYIINYVSGESRLSHVLKHSTNNANRSVPHGVFDDTDDIFGVIDDGWQKKIDNSISPIQQSNGNWRYEIPMQKRIGWEGGMPGAGIDVDATWLVIVVKQGTQDVVTAFPAIL